MQLIISSDGKSIISFKILDKVNRTLSIEVDKISI